MSYGGGKAEGKTEQGIREALWNFPRQDHDFKESRGFPGMELGIFRVAKSSGEGRIWPRREKKVEGH